MNLVYWNQPQGDIGETVSSFRINKCIERLGVYSPLITLSAKDAGGVWVLQYFDNAGLKTDWYTVDSLDTTGNILSSTGPRKGQPTSVAVLDILWALREDLGDTDNTQYCFTDSELLKWLNESLVLHDRTKEWDTLTAGEDLLIRYLAKAKVCEILAQDNGKYYPLSIDGIMVDKSTRTEKYLNLAREYRETYTTKRDEWQTSGSGSGFIQESYLTRISWTTGRRVSYNQAQPPKPIKMLTPALITAGSVYLRWTQDNDPIFYYYCLFRSTQPNVQSKLIEDVYAKRIVLYDDPGDGQNALWGGVTVPIRQLYRNQVTGWIDANRNIGNPFYQGEMPRLRAEQKYYYVVAAVNRNILISISNEIAVTLNALAAPVITSPVLAAEGIVMGQPEPSATVELSLMRSTETEYTVLGTQFINAGSVPFFRFSYGSGWLAAGDKLRVRQQFNDVWSGYSEPVTVI